MNYKCLISAISCVLLSVNIANTYGQDTVKANKSLKKPVYTTVKSAQVTPATTPAVKPVYHQPVAPIAIDSLTDKSLNGQYNQVLSKIYRYQAPLLTSLHKSYMDTLNAQKRKLKEVQATLTQLKDTINTLKTQNSNLAALPDSNPNQVSFLGIQLAKNTYTMIMWTLVIVLALALALVKYLSRANKHEAEYRTKLYEELSAEYQTYKVKANDKEKKLARELQTERNKLDEMRGK